MKIVILCVLLVFLTSCKKEEIKENNPTSTVITASNKNELNKIVTKNQKYELPDIKIVYDASYIKIYSNYLVPIKEGNTIISVGNDIINLNIIESNLEDYLKSIKNDNLLYTLNIYDKYVYKGYKSAFMYLNEDLIIQNDHLSKNTKARPCIKREIKYIVIHETGNTDAGALNHAKYLKNNENKQATSWHYTVDNHYVINHIPDNEVAYHAGDGLKDDGGNKNGIGIEMCVNKDDDFFYNMHRTAKLTAHLIDKYNLDLSCVKTHSDFAKKNCPLTINNYKLMNYFKDLVNVELFFLKNDIKINYIDKNLHENGNVINPKEIYQIEITKNLKTYLFEI